MHPRPQLPQRQTTIRTSRKTTQMHPKQPLAQRKPPSEHAPKPDKNAAPHHPRKVPNVAFWSPKRRSYTAKATTRLHLEKMGPDASASNVAASATASHHPNTPQNHAKTHRDTTQKITISVTSLARSPWNDGVGGYVWTIWIIYILGNYREIPVLQRHTSRPIGVGQKMPRSQPATSQPLWLGSSLQLSSDFKPMVMVYHRISSRWWQLKYFLIFTPILWGNDPIWLIFFKWVEATN